MDQKEPERKTGNTWDSGNEDISKASQGGEKRNGPLPARSPTVLAHCALRAHRITKLPQKFILPDKELRCQPAQCQTRRKAAGPQTSSLDSTAQLRKAHFPP